MFALTSYQNRQPPGDDPGACAVVRFRTLGLPVPDDQGVDQHMRRLVDTVGQRNLYVDFDQVPGLTSGQIGGLLGLHKRLRVRGGHLILGRVNPSLYEVFDRMRLTRLLDIRPGRGIECVN
jgi:hypothetical protein